MVVHRDLYAVCGTDAGGAPVRRHRGKCPDRKQPRKRSAPVPEYGNFPAGRGDRSSDHDPRPHLRRPASGSAGRLPVLRGSGRGADGRRGDVLCEDGDERVKKNGVVK